MVPARLNVITLGARDLPRLRSFYVALGWEVAIEAEDFCAFQLRGALLALFPWDKLAADGQATPAAPTQGIRGFSLGISVDRPEDVDDAVDTAEKLAPRSPSRRRTPRSSKDATRTSLTPRRTTGRSSI